MSGRARFLFACLLVLAAPGWSAETVYVTDVLQLAMHEREKSEGRLLRNLPSGTVLEVLARKGNYAKVRTQDGLEGWTKSLFLVSEKPARLQLTDLRTRNEQLESELTAIRSDLRLARERAAKLQEKMDHVTRDADTHDQEVSQLRSENEALQQRLVGRDQLVPLNWSLGAALASLVLGFLGGIAWFDYRSRRRHGGYRIY